MTEKTPARRKSPAKSRQKDRIAVVAGLRTPFARQLTEFKHTNAIELGKMVVAELMQKTNLAKTEIDLLVFGNVLVMPEAPNIAREIVLGTQMSVHTDAYSVSRACATSYQSAAAVADSILCGRVDVGIAGGADSASVVPIQASKRLSSILVSLSKTKSLKNKLSLLSQLRLKDLIPEPPSIKEYSTGLTMGTNAEQMARDHHISRKAQDDLAFRSHVLASKAWEEGVLDAEVMTSYIEPFEVYLARDNNIRFDSQRESYDRLKPAFDKKYGTVTAANSTPLTDGASAIVIMSEQKAKALGYQPLGYIQSY
ncbi:MAG TPA: acetyl-CoA C-acyltransferase, partial [Aeromonadales bacterium]|nr:acetyl-CoA C-acyltransferase [Aeromonadales bacterium]